MENTAGFFISPASKSFPVNGLRATIKTSLQKRRKYMNRQVYTLCEAKEAKRKELPVNCDTYSTLKTTALAARIE
jgi:hypothetical protein